MADLSVNKLIKEYNQVETIHSIDLEIKSGEFIVLVGPSGCGKSTLLRMVAGLEDVTSGDIFIGDDNVTKMAAAKRGIAMVFQSYALYPHMSVRENLSFGLKNLNKAKDYIEEKIQYAVDTLQLSEYLDRLPSQLSGGQRQRIAIGRAIVRDPKIFLFDEPLSNLDTELRVQMRHELIKLHKKLGNTMIYVTHDQVEAMTMADRIVVLDGGNIAQVGAPLELYNNPKNVFTASFIGSPKINLLDVTVLSNRPNKLTVELENSQTMDIKVDIPSLQPTDKLRLGLRPEHMHSNCREGDSQLSFTLGAVESLGDSTLIYASLANRNDGKAIEFRIKLQGQHSFASEQMSSFSISPGDILFFDQQGQNILTKK